MKWGAPSPPGHGDGAREGLIELVLVAVWVMGVEEENVVTVLKIVEEERPEDWLVVG